MIRFSGRFRSAIVIGLQGIRAHKTRTFLSMVSLFLGVLAIVTVQAGSEIAERSFLTQTELSQGRDGTLQMYLGNPKAVPVALETLRGRSDGVALTSTNVIIGEPGVRPVNPGGSPFDGGGFDSEGGGVVCDGRGNCYGSGDTSDDRRPSGQAIELSLTALTGDIRRFRPFRPVAGEWLDFTSAPSLSPRLVVNREAAKGFQRNRVPAEMRIPGATTNPTPQIVGVVDDGNGQPTAYVRSDELTNWLPPSGLTDRERGETLQILLDPTATSLEHTLRARLVANGVPAAEIRAERIDAREQGAAALAVIRWIFLGMASLVLLIGVAGILNVGLATVGERVEEFALRRAVGTPRLLLAGIVLAETMLTGLLTAAAAVGTVAMALRLVVAIFGSQEPALAEIGFPWQAAVAGVVAGLFAGVLGGLVPAVRAARIPIATVMRA